jgi:ankyrin repeat protein
VESLYSYTVPEHRTLSQDGTTPMHYAARKGQIESIKALVAAGADVNAKDVSGLGQAVVAENT